MTLPQNQNLKEYSGTGKLTFTTSEIIDCEFIIKCHYDGTLIIICNSDINDAFINILRKHTDKKNHELLVASLTGQTTNGSRVSIEKLALNTASLSSIGNTMTKNPDGNLTITSNDPSPKGVLELVPFSNVYITLKDLDSKEIVTLDFGIFNLIFTGYESSNNASQRRDQLTITISGKNMHFIQDIEYEKIIGQIRERKVAITSNCLFVTEYGKIDQATEMFNDCEWLLSFATSNWITSPFLDIYKNSSLIKTIIYPVSTRFPYIHAQEIITDYDSSSSLKEFLETTYENYAKLKREFGLNHLVEYYISGIGQRSLEEKFLLIATAFECLNSHLVKHARNCGDILTSGDFDSKKQKIEEALTGLKIDLDQKAIEIIARSVTYDNIGLIAGLRYLFDKYSIKYDNDELKTLSERRNKVMHSGIIYSGNKTDLVGLTSDCNSITSLLIRTILTLLGWKGKMFIDRGKHFEHMILD